MVPRIDSLATKPANLYPDDDFVNQYASTRISPHISNHDLNVQSQNTFPNTGLSGLHPEQSQSLTLLEHISNRLRNSLHRECDACGTLFSTTLCGTQAFAWCSWDVPRLRSHWVTGSHRGEGSVRRSPAIQCWLFPLLKHNAWKQFSEILSG